MNRLASRCLSGPAVLILLLLTGTSVYAQTQTPGQVTKFDPSLNVVDSVITEDVVGNIGIGTTTPAAKLDVIGGNLNLENSSETAGNILKGGALFMHNFGFENTFIGIGAGNLTMNGQGNTATGFEALHHNQDGPLNTATGVQALHSNISGGENTASGSYVLEHNTTGSGNTGSGFAALDFNTGGSQNTASGVVALNNNTIGSSNTASPLYS